MQWRLSVVTSHSLQNITLLISFLGWPEVCTLCIQAGSSGRESLTPRHLYIGAYNVDISRLAGI